MNPSPGFLDHHNIPVTRQGVRDLDAIMPRQPKAKLVTAKDDEVDAPVFYCCHTWHTTVVGTNPVTGRKNYSQRCVKCGAAKES